MNVENNSLFCCNSLFWLPRWTLVEISPSIYLVGFDRILRVKVVHVRFAGFMMIQIQINTV